jgi:DNA invertase Pin-like site-specific DNA recombinase
LRRELKAAGCGNIYVEKVSGAKTDREALARLLKRLDRGDMLVVTRLDRLARSTRDLLNILDVIGKAGATFKSLGDSWADTSTPHGRLMLTVLGGRADQSQARRRQSPCEGRVRFGRPVKLTAHQRQEALQRLAEGEAQADVARSYPVSQATISRLNAPSPFEAGAVAAGCTASVSPEVLLSRLAD